ncbi:uncharacterized protein IWZ02DRAFT_189673 [Phyllosticta citriasiana]|uniref:Secreted protein n=1 Tax=Phyllosticta citriasiana TaxID=595635 RepID=A0ABR1KFZ8_9PEZI
MTCIHQPCRPIALVVPLGFPFCLQLSRAASSLTTQSLQLTVVRAFNALPPTLRCAIIAPVHVQNLELSPVDRDFQEHCGVDRRPHLYTTHARHNNIGTYSTSITLPSWPSQFRSILQACRRLIVLLSLPLPALLPRPLGADPNSIPRVSSREATTPAHQPRRSAT